MTEKMPKTIQNDPSHIVFLVPGIRTHADWFQIIRNTLLTHGFKVVLSNYGKFDLIRFLLPIGLPRRRPQQELFRQMRDTQKRYPNARISVIAHSFGTYLISRILQQEFDMKFNRIIFVGSVVGYNFPFENFSDRFEGDILNEVGTRDPWPVLAESVTTGYGSTGTYGFKRQRIFDVWTPSKHSEVLSSTHCKERWIPFLRDGTLPNDVTAIRVSRWIRFISLYKIKYVLTTLLILVSLLCLLHSLVKSEPIEIANYPGSNGWSPSDNNLAQKINDYLSAKCDLEKYIGISCRGYLAKFLTKREWRTIQRYDSKLNDIAFPTKFERVIHNPLEFWRTLTSSYPNCIEMKDNGSEIELLYLKSCDLNNRNREGER